MKAIVQERYGSADVLELKDIDQPEIGGDEVLVRVLAASAHIGDWHFMTGLPYLFRIAGSGLRAPKARVRGTDVAGRVEAVGKDVTQFSRAMRCSGSATVHSPSTRPLARTRWRPSRKTSPSSKRRLFPLQAAPRSRLSGTAERFCRGRRC